MNKEDSSVATMIEENSMVEELTQTAAAILDTEGSGEELESAVDQAIADGDAAMEQERSSSTAVVVDEPPPAEKPKGMVGDRSALMLLSRRTGLPVLGKAVFLDTEPLHLVDTVIPVIAIRGKKKGVGMADIRSAFNPVLMDDDVFQSLIGMGEDSPEYFMKLGVFSFNALGVDRLRYSRFHDELLGTRDLERAIKHLSLSILANPEIEQGVYGLRCDGEANITGGGREADEIAKIAHRAMYSGRNVSKLMGMPSTVTLAMERHEDTGDIPGEKYWPLAKIFHRMGEIPEGQDHFNPFTIKGIFTHLDAYRITSSSEEGATMFSNLYNEGKIQRMNLAPGNMRDFVLGKFAAGLGQLRVKGLQREIRSFLQLADEMVFKGTPPELLEKTSQDACRRVIGAAVTHVERVLAPHLIAKAIERANRRFGKEMKIDDLHVWARRVGEDGTTVQDPVFSMCHADKIARGALIGMPTKKIEFIEAVSKDAATWNRECLDDVVAAASGLKSMFVNRVGDRVDVFVCHLDASTLRESIETLGTRPSFFCIQGAPVQVLDRSWDSYVPSSFEFYLKG